MLVEFLPRHDAEDRAVVTEAIGHMLAYAQMTDTRMVALLGDPEADAYELLFSFNSPKNKAEFRGCYETPSPKQSALTIRFSGNMSACITLRTKVVVY